MLAAQLATALQLTEQLAHAAVSLLDRTMMTGAHMAAGTEVLVAVACLRIAALHEGAFVPTLAQVAAVVDIPGGHSCLLHVRRECICMRGACGWDSVCTGQPAQCL